MLLAALTDDNENTRPLVIDEDIFPAIAGGSRDAFCQLYEEAAGAVYAYALSILHNRDDADDVMQDTFMKIRSAAHLYRPMGKPLAWIFTITRNLCLMKYRSQKRISPEPAEGITEGKAFEAITDLEDRMVMETAFKVLKDDERQIIILHAVTGMKHREIAEIMGSPLSTVLSKYNRG
ncbi:MAG: RNA polymerase sigma factor, partial [Lachnospiraceae bacterium]|nr:RNA polymerase sigma factor [Lachnospiraceae bacterium]